MYTRLSIAREKLVDSLFFQLFFFLLLTTTYRETGSTVVNGRRSWKLLRLTHRREKYREYSGGFVRPRLVRLKWTGM